MLSPYARRLALDLDQAIRDGDTRRVIDLVDGSTLTQAERVRVCNVLGHPEGGELRLIFDRRPARPMIDPAWTPAKGYAHAAEIMAKLASRVRAA